MSIADLLGKAQAAVDAAADLTELDAVRVQYLGKKGVLTIQLRELGRLPAEERPAAGKEINEAKVALGSAIDARREVLERPGSMVTQVSATPPTCELRLLRPLSEVTRRWRSALMARMLWTGSNG